MYRIWHLGKQNKSDILVRLLRDYPGKGGYVDLCEVNEKGEKIKKIISFSIQHGMLLAGGYGTKFTQYTDESLYQESPVPFYKIWHEPHKARNRLRLRQDYNGIYVGCVSNAGRLLSAQNIVFLGANIAPCTSCLADIPKDKNGGILRI